MNIAIVLFRDMEELDFAGPLEVFGMASKAYDASRYIFLKNLLPHRTGR